MNAAINSANWNCPPPAAGAACAQASVIKPFMSVSRKRKGRHYAMRQPPPEKSALPAARRRRGSASAPLGRVHGCACEEIPAPLAEPARGDGRAQRVHQAKVEMQVVDGVEA